MENKLSTKPTEKESKFIKTQLISGLILAVGSILFYLLSKILKLKQK